MFVPPYKARGNCTPVVSPLTLPSACSVEHASRSCVVQHAPPSMGVGYTTGHHVHPLAAPEFENATREVSRVGNPRRKLQRRERTKVAAHRLHREHRRGKLA